MAHALLINGDRLDFIKVVQRSKLGIPLKEYPAADPVRQEHIKLVRRMTARWDGENVVKFFESPLLRFCM